MLDSAVSPNLCQLQGSEILCLTKGRKKLHLLTSFQDRWPKSFDPQTQTSQHITMAEKDSSSKDLPLSANLQDIMVKHFFLDLSCHMARQVFEGSITLWCHPTQSQGAAENKKMIMENAVPARAAEEVGTLVVDRTEQLPSGSFSELSGIASQAEEGQSDEGNRNRHKELLTQGYFMDTDIGANHASVSCVQTSSSISGSYMKIADKPPQIEAVKDFPGTVMESDCGSYPNQRRAGDCSLVHSVGQVETTPKDLCEKSTDDMKCTDGREMSDTFGCSPRHQSDFITTCSHDKRHTLGTDLSDIPGCLKSSATCGTNKNDVQRSAVQPSVLQGGSVVSLEKCCPCMNERTHMCGCPRSDPKCDNTFISNISQTAEKVDKPCASHISSSVLNQTVEGHSDPFRMILDCFKLDIEKVEGVYLLGDDKQQFEEDPDTFVQQVSKRDSSWWSEQQCCSMQFTVKEHCIHIFAEEVHSPQDFPQVVQIWYQTQPSGPSLKWTKDQNDQPCVFTLGHFLSNRSLFPSQDFPTALLTWQASITVDPELMVVLTGDADPQVTIAGDGRKKFSYFTDFPMPTCTFAVAVGSWEMETLQYGSLPDDGVYRHVDKPPIRLIFPMSLKEKSMSMLSKYLPQCMLEVQRMLGRYPFRRLEVLLVPSCFDSLGMASPSLLFLSQSILCGDGTMCVRVAHELCHTWFGLVIGPRDWTEEWMTEGFCTYLEDILHAQVIQLGEVTDDYLDLRAELHLRVLKAEMENTDENLQSLRPSKGQEDPQTSGEETRFLKNGMNVEKKFMQVHYLKGYFLLHALEREVGRVQFLSFLKEYVHRYLYQLVTSQEFLHMFFSTFTNVKHMSVESVNADWLDCPGMPQRLTNSAAKGERVNDKDNSLSTQVQQELTSVIRICRSKRKRRHGGQLYPKQQLPELKQMLTPQVLVLLDRLLEEKLVPGHVFDLLRSSYSAHLDNAEVCHRWCELVIKHRCKKWYPDVERFLIHHQAMGVYLYGEASISRCPGIIQLARSCFQRLKDDMPESIRDTVSSMLYGT